jgi:hypothetical protein
MLNVIMVSVAVPYKASAISLYRIRDLIKLLTNFLPSFSSLGEENLLSIIMTSVVWIYQTS